MAAGTVDERDDGWVEAGPFRAHLRHLMAVGRLDEGEAAVVLGLSTRAVRHLLEGRGGRPARRISPHTARRLLLVHAEDVSGLRWCVTPAGPARSAAHRLLAGGWAPDALATAAGVGLDELRSLEGSTRCNRLMAVRLLGLARALPSTVDDQDLVGVATAA